MAGSSLPSLGVDLGNVVHWWFFCDEIWDQRQFMAVFFFSFFCFFHRWWTSTNGSEWRWFFSGKNDFTVLGRKETKWQIPFLGFRVVKPGRSLRWKFSCWMILSIFTGIFMISTKAFCTTTSSFQAEFLVTSLHLLFSTIDMCANVYIYIHICTVFICSLKHVLWHVVCPGVW